MKYFFEVKGVSDTAQNRFFLLEIGIKYVFKEK